MASFSRRPSRPWTIDECALFAARKEFELLKLLATDKKAMAAARRLGLHAVQPQPPPTKATAGKPAVTSTRTSTADAPSTAPLRKNSRRKRSAARSARHHTLRQQQLNRCIIAMLFVARLRRRVRKRVLLQDLADLDELGDGPEPDSDSSMEDQFDGRMVPRLKKRSDRPPSSISSSAASSRSSSSDTPRGCYEGKCPPVQHRGEGWDRPGPGRGFSAHTGHLIYNDRMEHAETARM